MKESRLAQRTRRLEASSSKSFDVEPPDAEILDGLRRALLDGETHYTDRPGIRALREAIATRLALPGRDADTIVVTAGEEEALFVARLASKDVQVVSLGARLLDEARTTPLPVGAVVTGSLDGLTDLSSFRVGFLSAPPELAGTLRSWKQALSICTAAPSQRAALLSLARSS